MHPIFVYGTLRRGEERFGLYGFQTILHEEAYLDDFQLLNIGGSFPGIVPGEGRVRGEVHLYSDLGLLDRIECFEEAFPHQSLFLRRWVSASLPSGEPHSAMAYVFNPDFPIPSQISLQIIGSGDWKEITSEG